jgi:hypothetical protein
MPSGLRDANTSELIISLGEAISSEVRLGLGEVKVSEVRLGLGVMDTLDTSVSDVIVDVEQRLFVSSTVRAGLVLL